MQYKIMINMSKDNYYSNDHHGDDYDDHGDADKGIFA
jgi:hypothetical protein